MNFSNANVRQMRDASKDFSPLIISFRKMIYFISLISGFDKMKGAENQSPHPVMSLKYNHPH